jgi:dihydroneopterin aldolase
MTSALGGDRIRLSGLRVFGHHGALPHERELGQLFVVDVDLGMDLAPAAAGDDLARTIHYGELAEGIAAVVQAMSHKLIETVAEDVAELVLRDKRVRDVRVRVTKPHAPLPVDAEVSVELVRTRQDPP